MSFDPPTDNGTARGSAEHPQTPADGDDALVTEAGEAPAISDGGEPERSAAAADADVHGTPSPEELAALTETAARAAEYLALAQRKQAEFENFRKRSAREAAAAAERGASRLALSLLPALDNLERALEHAEADTSASDEHGFVAGVRHVHTELVGALRKAGIEQFSPQGEPFDPTLHEAVAQQPLEGAAPGTVVEVYQRGYRMGETVVRPARVVVAG